MASIHLAVCGRSVWMLNSIFNYINILQPLYFNVFMHGNFLQCTLYLDSTYLISD